MKCEIVKSIEKPSKHPKKNLVFVAQKYKNKLYLFGIIFVYFARTKLINIININKNVFSLNEFIL